MALAAALAASLVGCANPDPPAPHPLRVNPDRGAASQAVAVVISGADFAASTSTDFEGRDPSTLDARFQASLDATPLRDVRLHADGTLTATVPDGIPIGLHDLVVVSPEGREGRLAAAYRALADAEVAQFVASYRIEPPGPQQAWAPFAVTITALDPAGSPVGGYNGAVTLSDLTGTAVPGAPALFRNGVWSGTVEIRTAHPADVLTVEDALGNRGASAPFAVAPTPAAALRFTTPPRSTVAGACSGAAQPLIVEVTDAFGLPTVAAGALALTPAAVPGLELFGDDACTMPLAAPVITAGSGSLTVWYRSTRATATVELSAAALTPASQLQTVVAGPPARVTFVSAPQLVPAGSCSLAATVEVRDAWENPALGGAVAVALASAPASGFELFSDAACATPASGVTSAGATARADFWFRGTTAQAVTVTASGASLAADAQVETVTSQAAASRLAFLTPPRTAAAGTCSGDVTVQAQDAFGNPVTGAASVAVSLGAAPAPGFAWYADAACTTPLASGAIPAGQSAVTVHFRGTVATAETLSATASGVTGATQGATIVPSAPHHLAFTSAPQSVMAGVCSAAAIVQVRDAFENVAAAAVPTLVALAAAPTSGFAFYSDATCTAQVSSSTIAAGGSDTALHFRATVMGTFAVDASAAGLGGASQVETITPAAADRLVFTTAPQTVAAGACSGVATVRTMDPLGNVAPVTAATTVSLAANPAAGFTFYTDSGCTSVVSAVTLAAGGSQQSFWFRGDVVGSGAVTVTATATGLTPASQTETLAPAAPSQLAFTTASQVVTAGSCSGVATVQARDALGNVSPVSAATPVNLTAAPSTGFTFYSDSGCTSVVSSITIAASGTQQGFWFRGDVVGSGSVVVTASASGLASVSQTETLTPGIASKLVFTTAAQTVAAGACSGVATVQARDPLDNPSPVAAATPVDLGATLSTGFAFYSDAACTNVVTSVTLPANGSQASFHFRGTAAGGVDVTASASGLGGASQAETLTPAAASKLVFTTPAQTVPAGTCSAVATVETRDAYGNVAPLTVSKTVGLGVVPGGGFTFYSDAACTTSAGSIPIAASGSQASFWFRGTKQGTSTVTASATGLTSASQIETIGSATAAQLVFTTAAQTVTAGVCSGAATVQTQDALGNVSPVASATSVSLTSSPTSGFTFYSDSGCANAVSAVTVAAGASQASFWFRSARDGAFTVTAASTGFTSASQLETIAPAPPAQLAFTTAAQTAGAGACSAIVTVRTRDALGNYTPAPAPIPVGLGALPAAGFTFYSDAGCTTAVTSVTIAAGASQVPFYFRGTAAGSVTVTASATGLTPASQTETLTPAAPSRLAFTTSAQTVTAGACSGVATVESRDPLGNVSPVGVATPVNLTAAPSTGFGFYSDSGCTSVVSSVTIAASGSQQGFWFRGDVVGSGSVVVTASATGLTSASQTETLAPAAPGQLAFTTAPQSVTAGACSGVATVQARDPLGNVSPVSTATAVNLAAAPSTGFGFYSDSGCTSVVSSITLAPGGSQQSFWFRGDVVGAGSVSVTASATGLASASQTETLTAGIASKLVFTTGAQTLTAGACSAIATIQQRDSLDNPVAAGASVALTLTALPAAGSTFYADAACAVPVGAGEPAIIAGSSTAGFYFKGTAAGTLRLAVSATGRTSAVQDETIAAGSPAKLAFGSAPQTIAAGTCSAATTLGLRDAWDNVAVAAAALDVGLAATPGTGFTFYADAACAIPASGVTVADGASTAELWFEGTDDGAVTVEATATGLAGATQVETIQPAAADHLDFLSAAQTVVAGACSGEVVVQSKDALENVSPVSASKTIALSASPGAGFTFYADSGCSSAVSEVTLAAGASQTSFWFRGSTAGTVDVAASVSGWTSPPTQPETIQPAAASQLVFSSPAQTVTAGACSTEVVLQSKDALGNVSPVTTAKTISLAASPAAGFAFYTDSGCSNGVSSVGLAAGTSQASFWFRGDAAGTVTVTASVSGWTAPTQDEVVVAGAATHFAWDAVSTPQTADRAFTVRITALDAFGNRDTTFALAATLSLTVSPPLSPVPTLTCTSGCAGLTATFSAGVWTGQVSVSEPASPDAATPDHWLVATAGSVTGTSAGFAVTGLPTRSPPTARLTASPAAAVTGQSVLFDASGSDDYQTPTADLMVSWDLTGAATAAPAWPTPGFPWSAWTTLKTAATTFSSTGAKTVRVAVRDADGDIGYAVVTVRVVTSAGNGYCVVDTNADGSDGATGCGTGARGADGKLSLQEALANVSQDGVITFASPMTISGTGSFSVPRRVSIVGYGVAVAGKGFSFTDGTSANPTRVIGLELTGQTSPITPPAGKVIIFEDVYVHDSAGFETWGYLRLERVRMENCTSACVTIQDTSSSGWLTVRASEFRNAGGGTAIYAAHADGGPPTLNVTASFFTGFQRAIWIATGGATTIVNDTFEANATAIQYQASTGHVLRNNVFTNQTVTAAANLPSAASFTNRDYHLLWQNASDGGLQGDGNTLTTDPLYLYPAAGDYRLSLGSPAVDSGVDTGANIVPGFPTGTPRYLGAAPDRGGYETW